MLLEVILSVLIIATGVIFIIRSYSASLRASGISTGLTKAVFLLEEKIFDADIKDFRGGMKETEDKGSEDDYAWTLTAQPDEKEKITSLGVQLVWKKYIINIQTLRKFREG
ncbi:MAG: hypothetical protein PHO42_04490 [Candidatus Omnitrophica bacterium]|nr:hypothetical protein [Candidatus Omnitrophota bacterium]